MYYGIYGDIIAATENALVSLEETRELLEYPEVQADKAYYLSILSKYNDLKLLNDKLDGLKSALDEEKAYEDMLLEASSDGERDVIYQEISSLKILQTKLAHCLADMLGCKNIHERAYCRIKLKEHSSKIGVALFELIKDDLSLRGAKIAEEYRGIAKGGYTQEISFVAEGADVMARLIPLVGAHKVCVAPSKSEEICIAVTPAASMPKVDERDLKIDVFHSSGAGGQHVNKVETAIRVTHLPTGISVVCQDERSQLKNKKRALENIEKKLRERSEQSEKRRIEADIYAQHSQRNTAISFDGASNTMSDTRLKAFAKVSFPLTIQQFTQYINGLMAL